jgi:hypothetical protein
LLYWVLYDYVVIKCIKGLNNRRGRGKYLSNYFFETLFEKK